MKTWEKAIKYGGGIAASAWLIWWLMSGFGPQLPPDRCFRLSDRLTEYIASKITPTYRYLTILSAAGVRSKDRNEIYFVTLALRDPSKSKILLAGFATNSIDRQGLFFAMPPLATTISTFADGTASSAELEAWEDGYEDSRKCALAWASPDGRYRSSDLT